MTAKEFLQEYRLIRSKIELYTAEIEKIEAQATGSQTIDGQPHGTSKSDKVAIAAVRSAELTEKLRVLQYEQDKRRGVIIDILGKITNYDNFTVLKKRYIDPRPECDWWKIADTMDRSTRQVQRIHGEALKEVQRIIDTEGII